MAQGTASRGVWMAELRAIGALAIPVVVQTSAQQGMTVTDQVFLGHLGTAELAAAALANAFTNLMWFFLLGFTTALDTLGSHAYGAGNHRALVTWCVAAAVLVTLLLAPLSVAMSLGEMAGRALFGLDPHSAELMGRFCDGLIPGMWPLMWGVVLTKYLQVQNNMLAPSLIAVATFLLNIAFNAVLVRTIGFRGAPMATSLSRGAQCLLLLVAVWHHERRRKRGLLAKRLLNESEAGTPLGPRSTSASGGEAGEEEAAEAGALVLQPGEPAEVETEDSEGAGESKGWWGVSVHACRTAMHPRVLGRFMKLGIPGGLSMAFEAGCFDFSTVLAGRLGAIPTAAHAAMLSVVTLTYLACPFALATAGAIRVGNLLGAGQPDSARRAGVLSVLLSGVFMAVMAVVLLASRNVLGYMFSRDQQVVQVIRDLALFAALFQVSDGLMGSSQGVLRGCGHQHLTAIFNFTGFWVCGVLLGYLLCFRAGLGLKGLWAGITSGDTATCLLNLIAMSRIRWRVESEKAVARLKALADQAEEEEGMLGGPHSDILDVDKCGLDEAGTAADAAVDGSVGRSRHALQLGGGRSYAEGLKRMWSERHAGRVVAEAIRLRHGQAGGRLDSVTARLVRRLSSFFRRQQGEELSMPDGAEDAQGLGPGPRRVTPQVELLP